MVQKQYKLSYLPILYVMIPDKNDSSVATMEVRRFLYNKRNLEKVL